MFSLLEVISKKVNLTSSNSLKSSKYLINHHVKYFIIITYSFCLIYSLFVSFNSDNCRTMGFVWDIDSYIAILLDFIN